MAESFDVVIIGSGAGGSPIAYELARAGKSVLVLEKGPFKRTQADSFMGVADWKRDEMYDSGFQKRLQIPGISNNGKLYYNSIVEPDLNDEPHIYSGHDEQNPRATIEGYTAQVVGGGTQLYGAVSLRFPERDLKLASSPRPANLPNDPYTDPDVSIQDWPIDYSTLEPFYDKAERLVGINGTTAGQEKRFKTPDEYQTPQDTNPISKFAFDGMQAIGGTPYRTPLAVITQAHAPSGRPQPTWVRTGHVNRYGDPMGYKSNTWVSLLRPTLNDPQAGQFLEIRPNCVVTHLTSDGSRVKEVHYRGPSGEQRTVEGRIVVVACSAIESVRLLMLSAEEDLDGFGTKVRYNEAGSPLGKYFLTHCFGGAEVSIPNFRADKTRSLDSDWAIDLFSTFGKLQEHRIWAGAAIYNNTSDQALPVTLARTDGASDLDDLWNGFSFDLRKTGEGMLNWLKVDFGTRLSVSFMANQVPWVKNRIQLSPFLDKWNRRSAWVVKDWHPHDQHLMNELAEQCKQILAQGVPGSTFNSSDDNPFDLGVIGGGSVFGNGVRIANHILGGARFGASRSTSSLDPNCRIWDMDNLYVTDGSFMPTSGGANPTLTIQANSFRVADFLKTVL